MWVLYLNYLDTPVSQFLLRLLIKPRVVYNSSGGRPDAPTKELKEDLGDSENLEYISIGKLNKFFIWRQEFKLKVYS